MSIVSILVIFALGLAPTLCWLAIMRKVEIRTRHRLRLASHPPLGRVYGPTYAYPLSSDHHYVEGVGYLVGDITCKFNARSAYLRCAVNPGGPCKECSSYESIEFDS